MLNLINFLRKNPQKLAEKLLIEKDQILLKTVGDKTKVIYKDKFYLPGGKDLFEEVAEYVMSKSKLEALKESKDLIMRPEDPNIIQINTTEEAKKQYKKEKEIDDKLRYKFLREENHKKGLFKEYFIFSFISGDSIEDALITQFLSNFRGHKGKNKRPIDIVFNPNVKFIGINLTEKKDKLNGFLIFAN